MRSKQLSYTRIINWWRDSESNRGHEALQATALPTELSRRVVRITNILLSNANYHSRFWRNILPFYRWSSKRYNIALYGALAEELGTGLQNPLHRCDSGTRLHGRVVELVYTTDLKSVAVRLEGSSPSFPTRNYKDPLGSFFDIYRLSL